MTSFSEQIAAFNRKAQRRIDAASKTATQETVAQAQTVRGRGGRMRVRYGFLRSSLAAAIGRMPSGESENPDNQTFDYTPDQIAATLLRWNPATETLFIGWTANYARPREYRDGFLRGAVENWDQNVEKASAEAQRRIP